MLPACMCVFVSLDAHLGLAPLRMSSALHTLPSHVVCLHEYLRCHLDAHVMVALMRPQYLNYCRGVVAVPACVFSVGVVCQNDVTHL